MPYNVIIVLLTCYYIGSKQEDPGIRTTSGARIRSFKRYQVSMPIKPELRWFYPSNWPDISRRVRFERAGGLCEGCRRPHGQIVQCLPDGRWFDSDVQTGAPIMADRLAGRILWRLSTCARRGSFLPQPIWIIIHEITGCGTSRASVSAATSSTIAHITWHAGGSRICCGARSVTCSLGSIPLVRFWKRHASRGKSKQKALTALRVSPVSDNALKPAASRPPSGRWGLTAPSNTGSGLICRKCETLAPDQGRWPSQLCR
jgi:hypothetical protein